MVPFRLPVEETLTIEKLVYGGEGLARLEGKVVLMPFVLPGEVVRAETERAKNDLWRGRLIEVLQPSPSRIAPGCPYFSAAAAASISTSIIRSSWSKSARSCARCCSAWARSNLRARSAMVSGEPWQYRNRVQLHIEAGKIGYFAQGSRDLVAIDHCPIASPKLNETIGKIDAPQAKTAMELFTNETEVQVNVLDRVPRPALTALATAGRDNADRVRRIPRQPQFVFPGESISDRSVWWNARFRTWKADGQSIFMPASGFFQRNWLSVSQSNSRRIGQQQFSRLGSQLRATAMRP